jgi:hypothetical protein
VIFEDPEYWKAARSDPEKRSCNRSDRVTPSPKKGGHWKSAKLQGFILIKQEIS